MALTEPLHLDSLCMLNSYISAQIDNCHFPHLENVWHIDSGASNHIIRDKANFSDYHLFSSKQIIWTDVEVKRYGSVPIDWIMRNGKQVPVILTNVLHVSGIITNLISVWKLDLKGIYWRSDDQTLCVIKTHKEVGVSRIIVDLYVIVTNLQRDASLFGTHVTLAAVAVLQPIELLHNRLGHLNLEDICKLIHVETGIEIYNQYMPDIYDGYA